MLQTERLFSTGFIEHGPHLAPGHVPRHVRLPDLAQGHLVGTAAGQVPAQVRGDVIRDPVQPGAQRVLAPDGGRLAGEHQKCGLPGVLGVVGMAEHPAADAQHHRPVALDQGGERGLVPARDEAVQQVAVGGRVRGRRGRQLADVMQNGVQMSVAHVPGSPEGPARPDTFIVSTAGGCDTDF